jgi:ribonuclease R
VAADPADLPPPSPELAEVTTIRARYRPHPRGFGFLTPVAADGFTATTFRVADDATDHDRAFVPPDVASGMLADDLVDAEVTADDKGVSAASTRLVERPRRMVVGTVQHGPGRLVVEPDPALGSGWLPLADTVAQRLPTSVGRQVVVLVGEAEDGSSLGRALVAGPHVVGSPQAVRAASVVVALGRGAPSLVPGGPAAVGLDPAATAATHTRVVGLLAGGARGAAAGLDNVGDVPGADLQAVERRDEVCLTIDDPSARDLDDALAARWDGGDAPVHVAVHIADAAAGVGIDSPADVYARTVATSAYFAVGDNAPMLDPALSEGDLSLLPNEDRSAISVRFAVHPDGEITDVHLEFCWITSHARLSYGAVEAWLAGDPIEVGDEAGPAAAPVREVLSAVAEAARRLGVRRDGRDTMESLFEPTEVDPAVVDGKLAAVSAEPHAEAYRLVERLMVAANESVAGWLVERDIPALYRAHAGLDPEHMDRIRAAADHLGVSLPALGDGTTEPEGDRIVGQVLAEVARLETEGRQADRDMLVAAVTGATLRATYDPDPAHHRGLGADAYTHFTSPIRRYADLVVHRQIRAALAGVTPPYDAQALGALATWLDARAGSFNFAQARERNDLWALLLDRGYLDGAEEAVVTGLTGAGLKIRLPRLGLNGFVQAARALGKPPRERASLTVDDYGLTTTSGPWRLGSRVKVRHVTLDDTGRPVFRLGDTPG